jgi:DNA-binding response OmpR family regulator
VRPYVGYLRRKLRRAASIDPVETVRGIGCRYHPRWLDMAPSPVGKPFVLR